MTLNSYPKKTHRLKNDILKPYTASKNDILKLLDPPVIFLWESTVPSGGNVTCLEAARQRDSHEVIMQNFKQFESCLDPCEART